MNNNTTASFDTDWPGLFDLSEKHEVTAIVYAQCKESIPKDYIKKYMLAHSKSLFYYGNRLIMNEKVERALRSLEHFTVKGSEIAKYYPVAAYRTMGDTDIVIHEADKTDAHQYLSELGPNYIEQNEGYEWHYSFNNLDYEIHYSLIYDEVISKDIYKEYFSDFWKYVHDNHLDWNYHFLYLILHLRKHFMNCGVGIRQFMDIAVLCSNGPAFDWNWIRNELKKLELWTFTKRVFALNEFWFDISPPLPIDPLPKSFFDSSTELILKNGVFGQNNDENKTGIVVNSIREDDNTNIAMFKLAVRKIFPEYEVLIRHPFYPYLKEHPYLLPFAWIHRFFRSIRTKGFKVNIQSMSEASFTDKRSLDNRKSIYEQWGL